MKNALIYVIYAAFLLTVYPVRAEAQIFGSDAEKQHFKPKEVKLDRNYDGVVDRVEIYDAGGSIARVETDTSGDGKIDEWVYYKDGKPFNAKKDTNADGRLDTFLTYDAEGLVTKSEIDTDNDGKTDKWVHYSGGNPVRSEKDTNGDGKPDTWFSY